LTWLDNSYHPTATDWQPIANTNTQWKSYTFVQSKKAINPKETFIKNPFFSKRLEIRNRLVDQTTFIIYSKSKNYYPHNIKTDKCNLKGELKDSVFYKKFNTPPPIY
jgi:hypothetical protein